MRQAVILVGGRGTRLGTLAHQTPKPLLPIDADRRFIDYLLEHLVRHGFEQIILLAGHLGDQVQARYHRSRIGACEILVVREPEPAGTGGALLMVRDLLDPLFLMLNGDSFFDFNVLALQDALKPDDLGVLALRSVEDARRYGVVEQAAGRVLEFREKDISRGGPAYISGGVYLLRRAILDRIGPAPASIETGVFPAAAIAGRLACAGFDGYFIDIGLPDTLSRARDELPKVRTRPAIFFAAEGTLIENSIDTRSADRLVWAPGGVKAVRNVNDAGWLAITLIATSASGARADSLGRERLIREFMQTELRAAGAHVDGFVSAKALADTAGGLPIDMGRSILVSADEADEPIARSLGAAGFTHLGGDVDQAVSRHLAEASQHLARLG